MKRFIAILLLLLASPLCANIISTLNHFGSTSERSTFVPCDNTHNGWYYGIYDLASGTCASPVGGGSGYLGCVCYGATGTWTAAGGSGGGSGTVTSVGIAGPSIFSWSGTPVTSSGTLTATLTNQSANVVLAGPSSGGATTPTFRALACADMPASVPCSGGKNPVASGASVVAWFDPAQGAYKDLGTTLAVNNDTVEQWNDQGGAGCNATQTTAGSRPTYETNCVNGLPCFDSIPTNPNRLVTCSVTLHDHFAFIGVIRGNDGAQPGLVYEQSADISAHNGSQFYTNASSTIGVKRAGNTTLSQRDFAFSTLQTDQWTVVVQLYNGTHATHRLAINGTWWPSVTTSATQKLDQIGSVTDVIHIGARSTNAFPYIGRWGDLVWINDPTLQQLQAIISYEMVKYNIPPG